MLTLHFVFLSCYTAEGLSTTAYLPFVPTPLTETAREDNLWEETQPIISFGKVNLIIPVYVLSYLQLAFSPVADTKTSLLLFHNTSNQTIAMILQKSKQASKQNISQRIYNSKVFGPRLRRNNGPASATSVNNWGRRQWEWLTELHSDSLPLAGRAIGAQGCSTKPHMKFSGRVFSGSSFWMLGKPILNKWELGTIQVLNEGTPGLHGKPCASLNSFYQKRQTLQEWQVLEQTQVANPTPNPKEAFRSIIDRACVLIARCLAQRSKCAQTGSQPAQMACKETWRELPFRRNRGEATRGTSHPPCAQANPFL